MKKLLAILLALAMVWAMAACSNGGSNETGNNETGNNGDAAPAPDLQKVEMTTEASGLEELTKVTLGAPKNMKIEENDWNIVFTDEAQNVSVEAYLLCDYNCYTINQEYAKETYEGYSEQKFGSFDGYYYISDSGNYAEVFVYLGCVAEIDDVYLSFSVSALDGEVEDPTTLLKLQDVQTLLCSAEFFPAQESAE